MRDLMLKGCVTEAAPIFRVRLHLLFSYQAKLREFDLVLWLDENAHAMEWGFSF